ncbi:MAG TPA: glycosyltransferase family 1 protein [Bryobacteraceae bacterium]|nr:glycosyltransferase family 1 protein [Bryobacteraceae bacterium]
MARIGVNALYLIPGGVGGTEIYLRELLAALAAIDSGNEYFVFTNLETGQDLTPKRANFQWKPQAVHAKFRPARMAWEQTILPLEASRFKLDVLFNPGFTSPILAPCPCVTVFHDLQHKRHPEYFRWFDLPFWRFFLWASVQRAARIVAVSEATRADLLYFYRVPELRIHVVHHGVDPALLDLHRERPERFVLCVSTLHPHKNIDRLIRAYAREKRDYSLALAGMRGFHAEAIDRLIDELGVRDRVTLTGWISRPELYDLYDRALACIYPSTFEGFGMPVLEAMAAGVPVACSDTPPLREVAGDTALYFDPLDEDALASALTRIAYDGPLRAKLSRIGRERARGFAWERAARQTLDVLLACC